MDLTTLIGIVTGVGCIYFGHALGDALPATASAALIVMGGTLGAVVTQFPVRDLLGALSEVRRAFTGGVGPLDPVVKQLVECARLVRREGLLAVEKVAEAEPDSFLKQAFLAMADGHDTAVLREQLNAAIDQGERMRQTGPRFFEAAGGYAPTIGILGAVLGLIQVMQRLGEPSQLGAGIAVAFVATVYGVGSANLIFLPLAGKLRMKIQSESRRREMIVDGVCAIQDGLNPQLIERRLACYMEPTKDRRGKGRKGGKKSRGRGRRRR